MNYIIRDEIPNIDDYINIRINAELGRKSREAATIGLKNSIFGVVVYSETTPVGIGRIVGDGGCFFEITDIAVLPDHQKRGLGRLIMERMIRYLKESAPSTAYVSLMADHGTPNFYEKFGFEIAKLPVKSGMFMRIP